MPRLSSLIKFTSEQIERTDSTNIVIILCVGDIATAAVPPPPAMVVSICMLNAVLALVSGGLVSEERGERGGNRGAKRGGLRSTPKHLCSCFDLVTLNFVSG